MRWPAILKTEAQAILAKIHDQNVAPAKKDALRFFKLDPGQIKVVILGQDPYPTPGVANGRAFAVKKDTPLPASLRNILTELKQVRDFYHTDRTLAHWEKQGVLLLNTALTVEHFKPNSHQAIWVPFTQKLMRWIDQNCKVTWVLWGQEAQKFQKVINHNLVLTDAHPSPLAFWRRHGQTFKQLPQIDW